MDAGARDQLTVVKFDASEALAAGQVRERRVRDEWTVVQFEYGQRLGGAETAAELTNAVVSDQLTV